MSEFPVADHEPEAADAKKHEAVVRRVTRLAHLEIAHAWLHDTLQDPGATDEEKQSARASLEDAEKQWIAELNRDDAE